MPRGIKFLLIAMTLGMVVTLAACFTMQKVGCDRSAATDVVPDRHAHSVSPSHSGSHAIVNTEIAAQ